MTMAYIYKITNKLNGKCYIGKTEKINPEERFDEHIRDAKKSHKEHRPLYAAFNQYGIEHFSFEILEETSEPTIREQYYIKYYNSYGKTGYNATFGGDGKTYLNHQQIIEDYKILQNAQAVANKNECHRDSVLNILKNNNIPILSSQEVSRNQHKKKVLMLNKDSKVILKEFSTYNEAGAYVIEKGYSNMATPHSAGIKISAVCRGKRKTFAGFIWELE